MIIVVGLRLTILKIQYLRHKWNYKKTKEKKFDEIFDHLFLQLRRRIIFILLWLILLTYPLVGRVIFQSLHCVTYDNVPYLRADFSIRCDEKQYTNQLPFFITALFVYPIGVMIWLLYILKFKKDDPNFAEVVKFCYEPFKPKYWWYECIDLIRRLILTGGIIFFSENNFLRLVMAILISAGSCMLACLLCPYESTTNNVINNTSLALILLAFVSGALLVYVKDTAPSTTSSSVYDQLLSFSNLFSFISIFLNICLLIFMVGHIMYVHHSHMLQKLEQKRNSKKNNKDNYNQENDNNTFWNKFSTITSLNTIYNRNNNNSNNDNNNNKKKSSQSLKVRSIKDDDDTHIEKEKEEVITEYNPIIKQDIMVDDNNNKRGIPIKIFKTKDHDDDDDDDDATNDDKQIKNIATILNSRKTLKTLKKKTKRAQIKKKIQQKERKNSLTTKVSSSSNNQTTTAKGDNKETRKIKSTTGKKTKKIKLVQKMLKEKNKSIK